MEVKKLYHQFCEFFIPSKDKFIQFLKVFRDKNRRLNLTLLLLFFLIFPNQNYYQGLQPIGDKPPIKSVNIDLPASFPIPIPKIPQKAGPFLTARSAIVLDLPSKTAIFSKQPDLPLLPASTTKIMTAMVALDYYKKDDILTVFNEWKEGQIIGFKQGEKLSFINFLYALLVGSGNDAAWVLAQNYPGGVEEFVAKMNQKGEKLHLSTTHFVNPAGIDVWNQKTTAHDLALLTAEALKNSFLKKIVATQQIQISDVEGENNYFLTNTNKLVGQNLGVLGVKTGWTEYAGECLVAFVEKDGKELITVVLGSQDRFGESKQLINWALDNFSWQTIDTKYQQLPGQNP